MTIMPAGRVRPMSGLASMLRGRRAAAADRSPTLLRCRLGRPLLVSNRTRLVARHGAGAYVPATTPQAPRQGQSQRLGRRSSCRPVGHSPMDTVTGRECERHRARHGISEKCLCRRYALLRISQTNLRAAISATYAQINSARRSIPKLHRSAYR